MSIQIDAALLRDIETLAEKLGLTPEALTSQALQTFLHQHATERNPPTKINQGDIFWLHPDAIGITQSSTQHPYVVVQDNLLNHSRIATVVVCALTSNRNKG